MTEPRLSTVFDYSDLRLHPDGTRVYQKSTNLNPRIAKVAVQTSRKNWIARDAGGLGKVNKFKRIEETSQEVGEFVGLNSEADSPTPEDEGEGSKNQGQKRKAKRLDGRKAKRQKFFENYDYLNKNASSSNNDAGTEHFPHKPSSDLLKCIHRYASEYYTESGQLLNSSRDYRKQKKARSDKKKVKARTEVSTSPTNSRTTSPDDGSLETWSHTSTQDGDYGNENGSKADESKVQRRGRQRTAKQYRDMYKVFDGSAIMAIGMLVQEYIAEALDPQTPHEWEEEMRQAFTAGCAGKDEGDTANFDIDSGNDSDTEVDSDEQDQDDGTSDASKGLGNDSSDQDDEEEFDDNSPSASPRFPESKSDSPEDVWAISDHVLTGRRVPQILQANESPDLVCVDLALDEDDLIESSSDESIQSSGP